MYFAVMVYGDIRIVSAGRVCIHIGPRPFSRGIRDISQAAFRPLRCSTRAFLVACAYVDLSVGVNSVRRIGSVALLGRLFYTPYKKMEVGVCENFMGGVLKCG